MNRIGFLSLSLVTLVALAPTCSGAGQPNILLIVSEDNGPELGTYGDPYARTPNLDKLAAEGVRFDRAFVAQAGCSPSRASFLTGLYPHQNGQLGLATWGFRMYREDTPNMARSLKEAGYRTGLIGKLHVNPESAFPFDFKAIPTANFRRKNLADYAKHAESFFGASGRPFFLSVNYPDAHRPWLRQAEGLPEKPLDASDVQPLAYLGLDGLKLRQLSAGHYNSMERLDVLVGDLLAALDRSGKADNTLVVYLGDHGADFIRGKRTCYEGGLRIPLIVRWPGRAKAGQARSELVSTVDLMPTFLAAAEAQSPGGLPGTSLIDLIEGKNPAWRRYLFAEFHAHAAKPNFYPQRSVRNDRYKLIESLMPGEINPGYDFTLHHIEGSLPAAIESAPPDVRKAYRTMERPPRFELYDLDADPFEFRNLADDSAYADVLRELQRELARWRKETKDPLLDERNLERLKAEAQIDSKPGARERGWNYPNYFFAGTESH
ncbi:MAG: sulfatase [Acidobacteriia bacterium]|nr:sulfatase [Terriglobia bacterium]